MIEYLISVGANVGDRAASIDRAVAAIARLPGAEVTASPLLETRPMYVTEQPNFLNGAVRARVALDPEPMLQALLAIERQLGRERGRRFGPRTIDLDIVAAGDRVIDSPTLSIPHPRMQEREFVLAPLAAIAPQWRHPTLGATVVELLDALRDAEHGAAAGVS